MGTRSFRNRPTEHTTFYPRLVGTTAAVASNSYLAVNAALDVLKGGGNAVDGAVAAALVEGVVNPQMHTIGGECPMLIRQAGSARVFSVNGNMVAPLRATPQEYRRRGLSEVPSEGVLAAGVPAAFGALLLALSRFGTMSFADVVGPARTLASSGFPVSAGLRDQEGYGLADLAEKFGGWPASRDLYLPGGRVPDVATSLRNPALARSLEWLEGTEKAVAGCRADRLAAVVREFYEGEIAEAIHAFVRDRDGLLEKSDLERFETRVEDPVSLSFGSATVFKCGFWTQGPVLLQTLAILRNFDLRALGHNSPDYLHLVAEAMKLAFADREQYYGDPAQTSIPAEVLLSAQYAAARARLVDTGQASHELRPGNAYRGRPLLPAAQSFLPRPWGRGTVHVDVVDRQGNMASLTPSGAWLRSCEVIKEVGFPLSSRMMTFYLEPEDHPNVVAPGRQPRTTLTPSLAFRDGKPWMTFGTMGGDQQDQWQLQFFVNRAVFGMTLQEAIEAPKFSSEHFPGFFAPHDYALRRLRVEPRVGPQAVADLRRRGHDVELAPDWSEGFLSGVELDEDRGSVEVGFDPRGSKSAVFPSFGFAW
ncbi:gamma-glutamyltransferase family protein [Frankia sp. Cj3]|uniref:gamma-glutamyltransferase family protein n=1 Tax=Frankia sp. Cj3 TaxID=2880976 RepID=UPI001EF5ECFC|nr:gamma-glutamyltransferase family protein [Frankia sp. Cj3]